MLLLANRSGLVQLVTSVCDILANGISSAIADLVRSGTAQLVAQPLGAYLLVKRDPRVLMTAIVFLWGSSLTGMAGCTNFAGLAATR